ncbi:DUF7220 family protein [Nitrobacter winogradskyi]|uniref:Uncharacterized protein n=2 Tax=Nitrobacter winogradskyi TaxID=913 RepID=A0ACC6AES9_NITWI|nr:hypothetical protein [Nitrobacter winogradskyi]MCP1998239.1 hypothetical protein [Nitrobacter winogradskyi]GEC15174.1 hypothetical protein NWI01_10660 [Nitrobacter winogradskyi]
MKQSKWMSVLESIINIVVGFGISMAAQAVFLPMLGVPVPWHANFIFALIMTAISIVRSFTLRRLFEALHIRRPLSPFMQAVIAERYRQQDVEGWDSAHDDEHARGDLAHAGAAYLKQADCHLIEGADVGRNAKFYLPHFWPWEIEWWKPTGFRRDLVKGCALGIAEGEKFDRNRSRKVQR